MADSILRLKVESQEYDNKLKRAADGLTRYADECRKVGGTLEVVEKDTLEYVRALGQMDTVSRTATGKLAEMKKTFTELSVVYNKMTAEEKQSPFGQALSQSLDQLKVRINDSKTELNEVNQSLVGGGGLKEALNGVASQFGMNIEQLTKFGGVVGATTTAIKVAKDAFFQSETNIDEWGRTVEGAKGAYNIFLDTLNNGNWSNFFQNLQTAIQGGRDLYDIFDRLGSIKSNNAAAIAIVQQQIAQLRLAKQQGENVDAQIKAATERLAQLQQQSINAGKTAGSTSAFQTIRNSVNSIGGAGVNDATIKYAVQQIMKNGQSEFDKYARNVRLLEQRGTKTRNEWYTDNLGIARQRPVTDFQISNLSQAEQRQYALAKAITEGETRIQKGISAYAQAVQEGTSSAREEFKGNRYALQGYGGSGRGGGLTDKVVEESIDEILAKQWETASRKMETMADSLRGEDTGPSDIWKTLTTNANESADSIKTLTDALGALNESEGIPRDGTGEEKKEAQVKLYEQMDKLSGDIGKFAGGFGAISSGLKSVGIKIPKEVDQVIGVISGVSQVIGGVGAIIELFSTSTMAANTVALGVNTATMVSLESAILANTAMSAISFFAGGGIVRAANGFVPGSHYSGDMIPALLNSGELVLNRAQQNSLANQLQGTGLQNLNLKGVVSGEQIMIVLDRHLQRSGRGELAVWK